MSEWEPGLRRACRPSWLQQRCREESTKQPQAAVHPTSPRMNGRTENHVAADVREPFAGTGTTLIAAEQRATRPAIAIEPRSPPFARASCDVPPVRQHRGNAVPSERISPEQR